MNLNIYFVYFFRVFMKKFLFILYAIVKFYVQPQVLKDYPNKKFIHPMILFLLW